MTGTSSTGIGSSHDDKSGSVMQFDLLFPIDNRPGNDGGGRRGQQKMTIFV